MSPRFAYLYFMKEDEREAVEAAVRDHVSHWQALALEGYVGGPFADRSGGLISFEADDEVHARSVVDTDPFAERGLLETYWLKRWLAE